MCTRNKGRSFAERLIEKWSPFRWCETAAGLEVDDARMDRFGAQFQKIYFLIAAALVSGSGFLLSTGLGAYVTAQVFAGICSGVAVAFVLAGMKVRSLLSFAC